MSAPRATRPGRPVTVALVGLGYWGPNLLRVLMEIPDVTVGWVCDLDPDRLARTAARYPSVSATDSFDDLLEDDEVDAIVLATPVFTHHALGMRALAAGKHTFIEKPLAPSSAQADELVELAEAKELVLMCGLTFLFSPPVRAVKELVETGALGDIFFVSSSRVNLGLHQRDVSVLWDLGPHDFSILLYWLGEFPLVINAVGRDSIVPGIPDVAFVDLTFPSEVVANVELSWLAPSKLRRTVVVGSEKMVIYDDGTPEPLRIFDHGVVYRDPETFGEYQLSYRTGDIVSPKLPTAEPLLLEMTDFVSAIATGRPSDAPLEIARDVVRLVEAAEASIARGAAAQAAHATR